MAVVTAAQLAIELETNPKRLARWLRGERERGHELLAGQPPGARWEFSRRDADRLAGDFKAAAGWPSRCGPGTLGSRCSTARRSCATRSSPLRTTRRWSTPTRPSAT